MTSTTVPEASPPASALAAFDLDPRKHLTPEDYERKNEDWYLTGLPLAAYDPNFGIGGGARAYFYENGRRDDALFGYTPYFHRVFLQAFATNRGVQFHWLNYDAPYFLGSAFRLRGQAFYEGNPIRSYFGMGGRSLHALVSPASGHRYHTMSAYEADLARVGAGGITYDRYDEVNLKRPTMVLSLERTFFAGTVRPLVGVLASRAFVDDYSGASGTRRVDGAKVAIHQGMTRLRADCDAGLLTGCRGGFDNLLRLGIAYDTRDFEPDPNSGVFIDFELNVATKLLGSDFDYRRALLSARVYYSPVPEIADLVLALRGTCEVQSHGTPFFSMNILAFTEDPRIGLGGLRTLRGFKQDRFVGNVMAVANAEVRWTFTRFRLWQQEIGLIMAPFVDSGRAFDRVATTSYRRWQWAGGGAFRVAWNEATVISADYGVSAEDTGLYVNFNHIF